MRTSLSQPSFSPTPAEIEDFEHVFLRLPPKGRTALERFLETHENDPAADCLRHWKRLVVVMARLAPYAVEAPWPAMKFYIADGKYRRQVFALEDLHAVSFRAYLPNILADAVARGLLGEPEGNLYPITRGSGAKLEFETITADTKDLPEFCKGMLGWGRKAVRTTVPATADERVVRALERLCDLAAEGWAHVVNLIPERPVHPQR